MLSWVLIMFRVIYKPFCAECRYAERRYAERRYALCSSTLVLISLYDHKGYAANLSVNYTARDVIYYHIMLMSRPPAVKSGQGQTLYLACLECQW